MWERGSEIQAPCDALAPESSAQLLRYPQQSFGVLGRQRLVARLLVMEDSGQVPHVDRLLTGSAQVEVPCLVSRLSALALADDLPTLWVGHEGREHLARSRNLVAHDVLTRGA